MHIRNEIALLNNLHESPLRNHIETSVSRFAFKSNKYNALFIDQLKLFTKNVVPFPIPSKFTKYKNYSV